MRQGLKLIGLSMLAALSLMAVMAASAQASGEFRIGTPLKTFNEAKVESKEITGTVGAGEILTAGGLKISCTTGTGSGTVNKGGTASASVLFTGCKVASNKFCFVYDSLVGEKLEGEGMLTAAGSGELVLMKENEKAVTKHYLLAASSEFSKFDIFGPLCPLNEGEKPLKVVISGSSVVELPDALEDKVVHTIKSIAPPDCCTSKAT